MDQYRPAATSRASRASVQIKSICAFQRPFREVEYESIVTSSSRSHAGGYHQLCRGPTEAKRRAESSPGKPIEEVIVTGTRRLDRTVEESAAPIDVLSGADLEAQSSTNMLDTLSNVVPSFIVGQNSISDASSFVRSPSLRGLPGMRCW